MTSSYPFLFLCKPCRGSVLIWMPWCCDESTFWARGLPVWNCLQYLQGAACSGKLCAWGAGLGWHRNKVVMLGWSHGNSEGAQDSTSKEKTETCSWSFCRKENLSLLQAVTEKDRCVHLLWHFLRNICLHSTNAALKRRPAPELWMVLSIRQWWRDVFMPEE